MSTYHEQLRQLSMRALQRPSYWLVEQLLAARPGAVVVDVGANIGGMFSHWFASGASKIHAFEPVPNNFEVLQTKFGGDHRIVLNKLAVSDVERTHIGVQVLNAHTLARVDQVKLDVALEDTGPFDIGATTLDAYDDEFRLPSIDFIKIDVDGWEPKCLRGAKQILHQHRPPIMLELSYLPRALGESCEAMIDWMYAQGYLVCTMGGEVCEDPVLVLEAFPWRSSWDVVCVPRELVKPEWSRIR